jgi:hypothetical protein
MATVITVTILSSGDGRLRTMIGESAGGPAFYVTARPQLDLSATIAKLNIDTIVDCGNWCRFSTNRFLPERRDDPLAEHEELLENMICDRRQVAQTVKHGCKLESQKEQSHMEALRG